MPRLLLFLALVGFAATTSAQPIVDGRIVTSLSGNTLLATVQIKTNTGTDDLGASTFRLSFNDAALDPASESPFGGFLVDGTDYTYHNFDNNTDANYFNATVSYPLQKRIYLNIELLVDNSGTVVPATWMDVVTLRFKVTNPAADAELEFAMPGIGDGLPAGQELYDGDNATLWTIGTFTGSTVTLPVELAGFEAMRDGEAVVLAWQTASETNNAGFTVELRAPGESAFREVGFVAGGGTTVEARHYTHRVEKLVPGRSTFRLRQTDFDGTQAFSPEVEVDVEMTEVFRLTAAHPNPFAGSTRLGLMVQAPQRVEVAAYDAVGRRVALLHEGVLTGNEPHTFTLDADGLPGGVYFLRVVGERFVRTERVVLVR